MEKLFDKKRRHKVDDDEMLDLGIPCVNIKKLEANGLLRVSQDQKGRLDKFTLGNVDKDKSAIDIVMYYNHIFNPFSVDEGDLLYTPLYDEGYFTQKGEPILPDGSKHSSNTSGEKKLTYAEKVEKAARTGLGIK
jgi:hypothetical protein